MLFASAFFFFYHSSFAPLLLVLSFCFFFFSGSFSVILASIHSSVCPSSWYVLSALPLPFSSFPLLLLLFLYSCFFHSFVCHSPSCFRDQDVSDAQLQLQCGGKVLQGNPLKPAQVRICTHAPSSHSFPCIHAELHSSLPLSLSHIHTFACALTDAPSHTFIHPYTLTVRFTQSITHPHTDTADAKRTCGSWMLFFQLALASQLTGASSHMFTRSYTIHIDRAIYSIYPALAD